MMTAAEFDAVVEQALQELPEWVRRAFDNIDILVEDEPDATLDPEGEGLLGLYVGVPLTERSLEDATSFPDVIYIFRRPHLALGLSAAALREEIRRTLVHEVAHYFGLDDDRVEELGWG